MAVELLIGAEFLLIQAMADDPFVADVVGKMGDP